MNVLIVDDEPIIRTGLRSLVQWEENGFRLVAEAADGVEALEWMRREPIDILITDIRMPKMDGLALMREVKSSFQDEVGMLVLSCLDDFAFVKEAMKLGAQDYILKPTMEPDELLVVLQTIRTKLGADRETKRELAEWRERSQQARSVRLAEWLRHYVQTGEGQERLEQELFQPGQALFSVWIEGEPDVLPAIDEWAADFAQVQGVVRWGERSWIVLFSYEKSLSEKERYDTMFSHARNLFAQLKEAAAAGQDWFMCLGSAIPRVQQFADALAVHRRQIHERFYGSPERFIAGELKAGEDGPLPAAERNDFLRAVSNGNRDAAFYWLERLTESVKTERPNVAKLQPFLLEMLSMAAQFAMQHDSSANESDSLETALTRIRHIAHIDPLCALVHETFRRIWVKPVHDDVMKATANPFIKKAVRFMREQYSKNISTVDIADHVKLSRSYLSDLFSKEMGESLSETLTRIRIEEAKRKLCSGEMKVYEIAEAVGFTDPKSFAKTFKRLVGCTPKEFELSDKVLSK
ncbi:MAG: two component transcriptional regulator, AraC family [Paenibacillus sp.]|jgi:two-component system response regulator YesN|nr:two component transcriptional regulator, AraC family [Paenibacillus sp.]